MPKIKKSGVAAAVQNEEVMAMFKDVLDMSGNDLGVIHPRAHTIATHVDRFLRTLEAIFEPGILDRHPGAKDAIEIYAASLRRQYDGVFVGRRFPGLPDYDPTAILPIDYDAVPEDAAEAFARYYHDELRPSNLVNIIVVATKNLIPFQKYIGNRDKLRDRFLTKTAGMSLCPLPDLPQLDIKYLYHDQAATADDRSFLLLFVHKLYSVGYDVYDVMSKPDIDMNDFVDVVGVALGDLRGRVARCDKAFDRIEKSVDLLRTNFSGYYKDFIASSNPSVIMESFVIDVSKTSQGSPELARQFRRIMAYIGKASEQSRAADPKLRLLLDSVDDRFKELAKLQKNQKEADKKDDDDDDDPAEETPAGTSAGAPEVAPRSAPAPTGTIAATAKKKSRHARRRALKNNRRKHTASNPGENAPAQSFGGNNNSDGVERVGGSDDGSSDDA
jgi:hypothetical protein